MWQDFSTADTLLVTTSGTYSVQVFNDCFQVTDTIAVTVNASPPQVDLPTQLSLCQGQNITLDAVVPGVVRARRHLVGNEAPCTVAVLHDEELDAQHADIAHRVRDAARGVDGTIETHFCEPVGHRQVNGDYVESWQPQPMSALALQRSQEIARAITDDLGGWGLFGVELFVKGDKVWFSEVSPRPHDTGMVTMITQWQNEFELHARAILGLPVDTALKSPGASAVIYGGVEAKGIVFDGVDEAMRVPNSDIRLFGKPESFTKRRMGVALVHDADVDVARTQAKLAASKVKPRTA